FYLALTLVLTLGLFAFFAPTLHLMSKPWIFLLGPELGDLYIPPSERLSQSAARTGAPSPANSGSQSAQIADNTVPGELFFTPDVAAYGARALVCLAFSFAGAIVWAVIYLTQRMALRDVTAYTYQEVTMRLVASAILAL